MSSSAWNRCKMPQSRSTSVKTDSATTENTSSSAAPLAIIGIGCLFPKANDQTSYWANIREGIDAITDIPTTHWKVEDYYSSDQKTPNFTYGKKGGFLSPVQFNPMEFN